MTGQKVLLIKMPTLTACPTSSSIPGKRMANQSKPKLRAAVLLSRGSGLHWGMLPKETDHSYYVLGCPFSLLSQLAAGLCSAISDVDLPGSAFVRRGTAAQEQVSRGLHTTVAHIHIHTHTHAHWKGFMRVLGWIRV